MSRLFILVLALVVAGAACAQATGVASRERALAAIKSGSPVERAEALAWIADHGTPADAAILRQRLTDDSGLVRGFAEQGLWVLWSRSGDKAIDALMTRGVDEMRAGRHADAIATFSEVIRKKPAFAEGWNKRATVLYLAGEYRKSIADCDQVIRRNPHHFGALAGFGQNYFELKEYEKAIRYWKRALQENPNMAAIELNIDGAEELLAERRKHSA